MLGDFKIVWTPLDHGVLTKGQTVVMLDWSELFVWHLDLTIAECIHLAFCELIEIADSLVIEACGLDQGTLSVYQIEAHDLAFTSIILPLAKLTSLNYASLNYPVTAELAQGLDRHVSFGWQMLLLGEFNFAAGSDSIHSALGGVAPPIARSVLD